MERNFKENTTAPLLKNMKSGKIFQNKALHFEKEDWSNLAKWSSLGVAAGGLTVHSERETSLPLSTLELSTSPFSSSRNEGELFSFHPSLDSSDATWSSNLMNKSSLDKILENQDISTDCLGNGHKETVRTCHIDADNGNLESRSSYIPLWSPEIWARARNVKSKYSVSASPGAIYPTSKIVSNVFKPSENQSNVASEVGVPRKPVSYASKKYKTLFAPNQEKISENLLVSVKESSDSHLTTSTSPSQASLSQGLIHRVRKNGLPYYTFSLNESYQVLVAKTWKAKSTDREDLDWMYTFHSSHDNKKTSNKNRWVSSVIEDKNALDLVGRMRVSSSSLPPVESFSSSQDNVQTEFVLFSATADIEPANGTPRTPTRLEEKSIFYPDQSFRSTTLSINSSVLSPTSTTSLLPVSSLLLQMPYPGHMVHVRDLKKSRFDNSRQNSFKPQSVDENTATEENYFNSDMSELAAIVISTPSSQSQSVKGRSEKVAVSKVSGGWGLKFLEKSCAGSTPKVELDCKEEKPESCNSQCSNILVSGSPPSRNRCNIEEPEDPLICAEKNQTSVTAIVPADVHGLPLTDSSRPSSLIERWRLDGKCDCGGWDIGCPITLFHGQKQNRNEFIMADPMIDVCHSSFLLFKGGKQNTPAFTIEPVDEGLYILSFHSQLSALQAFSICVALMHVGDPVMNESRKSLKDID
ncbi:hypothetical protein SUGI_0614240 [Cryptomeria japonica]|uniref:uncharacterized protein LOC131062628 n=1 Tax=Cryptomeria japonica TaxID=3369 RepID=UPI0024147D8E|nr:uncharacterized protein LOC131062628 [Cryptomeria japonica]XP_057852320.1 uncharacterized protein LOC131062628 [Cryptomeria japonica]XP_059063325.1 uncharacterized protein LOC131062628 [Cryptomeria japonica]GLJ30882.1 hypothetical protein SUGI_0614240 [Cryptomeria japonica]